MLEKNGIRDGLVLKLAGKVFHGCAAGRGFVYVKANGDVWPCPFVEINAGNVRNMVLIRFTMNRRYSKIYATGKKI